MIRIIVVAVFLANFNCSNSDLIRKSRSFYTSAVKTPIEMAKDFGYDAESHQVTTDDGYILTVHRIPRGRGETVNRATKKPVVFLMHCVFCSSIDWLMNYPEDALGYYLADNGYDVWMGNGRGNVYAKNHTHFDINLRQFWNFSFHEIAVYDLPASLDYALQVSGTSKLHYVGYSLGSVVFLTMMSEKPEYNHKIKAGALLGPASFLQNNKGLLFQFSPFASLIERIADQIGIGEIMNRNMFTNILASSTCSRENRNLNEFCRAVFSIMIDIDDDLVNQEFLPVIFSHMPAGGSLKTLLHLMQVKNSNRFKKYDYGPRKNKKLYGSSTPTSYNLQNVIVPTALYYGEADKYVPPEDTERLARILPNVVLMYKVPHPKFSHFDFLWAANLTDLLNKNLISFLNSY